jgi:hypothetical protein
MRTLFETSWVRDVWTPNFGMGQAGVSNPFADIANAAATGTKAYFDAEKAKDDAAAKEAQAKAQTAAAYAQAQSAAMLANQNTILGMSPSTAAIVGLLGVGAIIAVVMVSKKK